jgi:hypothetical protein
MKNLLLLTFILFFSSISAQDMTIKKIGKILKQETKITEGKEGIWTVKYAEHLVMIVTDAKANRMRIFSPIVAREDINEVALEKMLEANFHSALDAKYSIWEGVVISVYTHPLQELSENQFIDALQQVVRLSQTFGTSFSSTEFIFGNEGENEEINKKRINVKPKDKKS